MKRSTVVLLIFLFVFILCTLGLGGYIFYNKGKPCVNVKEEKKPIEEEKEDREMQSQIKVLAGTYLTDQLIFLHKGEVFVEIGSCSSDQKSYYNDSCSFIDTLHTVYQPYSFQDFEYESISTETSRFQNGSFYTGFMGLKLIISDVQAIYSIEQGQAISPSSQGLAMIKQDGSLWLLSYQNIFMNQLTPVQTSLENIVKVENRSGDRGMETFAIDRAGQEYNLVEILK